MIHGLGYTVPVLNFFAILLAYLYQDTHTTRGANASPHPTSRTLLPPGSLRLASKA